MDAGVFGNGAKSGQLAIVRALGLTTGHCCLRTACSTSTMTALKLAMSDE